MMADDSFNISVASDRLSSNPVQRTYELYGSVPKRIRENLDFREQVARHVISEQRAAEKELWIACRRDCLFFINTFCWIYDPRRGLTLPFITYPFQDESIAEVEEAIGSHDLVAKKSREMGWSWLVLATLFHRWCFFDLQSFLLVSRKEEYVEKRGDPKTLMWKIDFLWKNLPEWLRPRRDASKLHRHNLDNDSTIDGESTTGDVAAGDRRTAIVMDEFARVKDGHRVLASTRDVTSCRIFLSSQQGTGNAFYDLQNSQMRQITVHWCEHPVKNRGLYRVNRSGEVTIVDQNWHNQNPGYEFVREHPTTALYDYRSPWYDAECKRAVHPYEIAQELDIDPLGSDYQFFEQTIIDDHMQLARGPLWVGDLEYDPWECEPKQLDAHMRGPLRLWTFVDRMGRAPTDRQYVFGIDVAAGTGATPSTIAIGEQHTRTKIGEYANNRIPPEQFAKYVVSLARFFAPEGTDPNMGAYLLVEVNGPGRIFMDQVVQLGYRNIYCRRSETRLSRKSTDEPGFFSTRETKLILLGEYRKALKDGLIENPSREALRECMEYVYISEQNNVAHRRSVSNFDPSGQRENHGDRVIADALLWKGLKEEPRAVMEQPDVPDNTFRGRQLARIREEEQRRLEHSELGRGWAVSEHSGLGSGW